MSKSTTKRSLLVSVLALVMCVAMLVGTTFAWFTDSASTSVNKIEAGKLDIDVYYADTADGGVGSNWTKLDNNSAPLSFLRKNGKNLVQDKNILWEPNCTYSLPALKIVNSGNLALKYRITITGIRGDAKLNEVIDWTFGGLELVDGAAVGALLPKAESNVITVKGHMDPNAGNEYQGLTIEGIGITVYATQDTVEFDSINNTYDAAAPWVGGYDDEGLAANADAEAKTLKIESAEQLASFAKAVNGGDTYDGYTVTLMNNIDLNGVEWIQIYGSNHKITFDGNGKTISNLKITKGHDAGFFANGVDLTVKNVTFDKADVTAVGRVGVVVGHGMCAIVENCKVTNSTIKAVVTNNDDGDKAGAVVGYLSGQGVAKVIDCTVENCTVEGYRDIGGLVGYAGETYTVTGNAVKNVTLINDQSNNYKKYTTDAEYDVNYVIGEQGNDGTYENNTFEGCTISKIAGAADQTELNNGIQNSTGDVAFKLPSNTSFTLDNGIANVTGAADSRNITFVGDGTQTVDVAKNAVAAEGGKLNYQRGSTFTFENMTITAGANQYEGIVCDKLIFKNCTIKGFMTTYSDMLCENCVFERDGKGYLIDFYGGKNFEMNNCQFKGLDKNVYVYVEGMKNDINVVFNDCTFSISAHTSDVKSSVMLNAPQTYNGYTYNVTFNRCSQTGGNTTAADNVAGKTNYQGIYGLKHKDPYGNGLLIKGTVTIDGKVVYKG